MRNRTIILLAALFFAAASIGAQELVFFEGDVTISEVVDDGAPFVYRPEDIYYGFQLGPDFIVETGSASYAEIVLPNGHVLKLADNTEVKLESVVARAASGDDRVAVSRGRLRSVVASLTGTNRTFAVQTPSAVGGVRGTDFVTQVVLNSAGAITQEAIGVLEGVVGFAQSGGAEIAVAAGQFADALGSTFQAQAGNIAQQFYGGLQQLSQETQETAQQIVESLPSPEDEDAPPPEDEDQQDSSDDDTAVQNAQPSVVGQEPSSTETSESESDEGEVGETGESPVDLFMANLTDALGLDIGTITLEGTTWSKLVAQPTFQLGKLRAGLYLPVIYSGNLFSMDDWYRPKGNNEWSFGADQDWRGDTLAALGDLVGDLALKIKFIEWGQQRDPFFFKVGNLNTLTLGHGLLMRNYANDTDFPAIRRIGFNLGIDGGRFGFEALVNDLAAPEIFGARVYVRPLANFPMAVGVGGITDTGPARDLPATLDGTTPVFVAERAADPLFLNLALDVDLPVFERPTAAMILYGDIGGLLPYLRADYGTVPAGAQWNALWYDDGTGGQLRNYGIATGLFGNIALFDYRLEFRNFRGIFQPAFYDSNYDRIRSQRAREVLSYLENADDPAYDKQTLGVFGEAGFDIAGVVRLEAGYLWPWTQDPDTNEIIMSPQDRLAASLEIQEGLLPFDITAGFSYERSYFVPTIAPNVPSWADQDFGEFALFDENTVLKGEIVYPVAPIMDIAISVTTTILRDESGAVQYTELEDGSPGRPKYGPVISVETRLGAR